MEGNIVSFRICAYIFLRKVNCTRDEILKGYTLHGPTPTPSLHLSEIGIELDFGEFRTQWIIAARRKAVSDRPS